MRVGSCDTFRHSDAKRRKSLKTVPLRESPSLKTVEIIKAVLERPTQGAVVSELRARCRVLDALDRVPPDATELYLEDADHDTLVRAVNTFVFGLASKELLAIGCWQRTRRRPSTTASTRRPRVRGRGQPTPPATRSSFPAWP